jgi:ABC-type glycerol-3-phosphate transport system substrate-binding protein
MKKVTLLLLSLLLVAATSVFAEGGSEGASGGTRPELEITTLYHFDNGDPTQFPELKAEWKAWFADYFGVDFKVNYYPRPEYMQKFTLAMSSNEIKGFGQIFGGSYADDFYGDGATVDVLPYIKDNGNWTRLPEEMKAAYMRDGELIAMPSAWAPGGYFVRSIRKDWLDKFGLDIPETIDELYTAVKMFTENDPDGNGKDDTVGMTSSGVWNMQDIFHAFGVPSNHVGDHLITADPHDGMRINDGMLKPQIIDCLTWLADVYQNGYMDAELWTNGGSQMRERMQSGFAGSTYYWTNWVFSFENGAKKVDPNADIEPILGLTTEFAQKYTNLGGAYGSGVPWPLLRGTKNAEEQANLFLDIFLGDDIGHFSGWFGVYEKYWEFGPNGEIVRIPMEYNDEGKPVFARGPNVMAGNVLPFFNLAERGYKLIDNEAAGANYMVQQNAYADWIKQGNTKDIFFKYNEIEKLVNSETMRNVGADMKRILVEAVTNAMTGQATPEEAVATYRAQAKALGGQQILDEANAYLGRTSSSVYRY